MKIAIIGAGAIGSLVAGYLKIKGEDVTLTGSTDSVRAIKENGLVISGSRGDFKINVDISTRLEQDCGLAVLAVKTRDLEKAVGDNLKFLKNAAVVTTQNGISCDAIASRFLAKEQIISSIVMFGATYLDAGHVVHNFDGNWILGSVFGANSRIAQISHVLKEAFPVVISDDIKGMKYLKIFVNANNCLAAILGLSMQEAFSDPQISRISIAIWKEGLTVVRKAGIKLVSLPDFPLERLEKLTSAPIDEAAKIFSGIMINLSKQPLYGSILQSIKRGKLSEIDYINGEFVRIAQENEISAGLNEKLVSLVHAVEKTSKFFSREELINATKGLF